MKFGQKFCLSFLMILLNIGKDNALDLKPYLTLPHVVSEADKNLIFTLELKNPAQSCKLTSSSPGDIQAIGDGVISTNMSPEALAEVAKYFDLQLRREFVFPIIDDSIPEKDKYVTITAECVFGSVTSKASKRVFLKDDDRHSFTSPLTLEICIGNVYYRNSPGFIKIRGLTGKGECKVRSSKPSFFNIQPNTFNAEAGSEHILTYKFKTPKNNEKKYIELIFDCEEENDGKKLQFVERITAINRPIRKNAEFSPVICSPVILCEGDEINLSILPLDGSGKCKARLSSDNDAMLIGKKEVLLLPDVMRFFTVKFPKSKKIIKEKVVIAIIQCKGSASTWTTSKRSIILRDEKDCYGQDDPHFQQKVFNQEKNGYSSLCYDVSGLAGDAIFILQEKYPLDVSIYGILLDDYYMHEIRVVFKWETIIVGLNKIELTNSTYLDWTTSVRNVKRKVYNIEISKDQIEISGKFNKFNKIVIDKVYKFPVGFHLNVRFEGLNEDFEGLGGLIGTIGNNNFQFFLPVQEKISRGAAIVNGKYFIADLDSRRLDRCWYMNVKDALYPHLLKDYVFNQKKIV